MSEIWFAWHPVQLNNGKWAWLRNVHRRLRRSYDFQDAIAQWEYWT